MLNEKKLTNAELNKREELIMKMKKNKRALVQKYGSDAEQVMYGRATNIAKQQAESMKDDKLREMVKAALQNPKAADLNKDGKLSDYEEKRGAAIEKNLDEGSSTEEKSIAMSAIKKLAKYRGVSDSEAKADLLRAVKELGDLKEEFDLDIDQEGGEQADTDKSQAGILDAEAGLGLEEDLDLGHEDNEPHMIKAELYRIGKYAMELYQMVDGFEGEGEVDFPAWWQAKITTSMNNMVGAKHYLDFEIKEPAIDAVVDRISDVAPEMEIDVVDDIEEIGMFHDPKGYEKPKPDPKDKIYTKKHKGDGVYDIFKNDEKIKTIKGGEGEANAYINQLKRELEEGLPKGFWDKKMDAKDEVDESYNTLVNKIKKQGQSEKSAKAIAGAVASYKAKGGGKGPTAKQKG